MFERKNQVFKLNLDGTYEDQMKPCKGGTIHWNKEKTVNFKPKAVFPPKKRGRIFKKPSIILFGERCTEAYEFSDDMTGLQPYWTEQDAKRVQDKNLAMSLEQMKPISWNIAIPMFILMGVALVFQIIIMNRLGVF